MIIPVFKPGDKLEALLAWLLKQTHTVDNIILVNTEEVFFNAKRYLIDNRIRVIHISEEEFDHAATRDMAIRQSSADCVLLMTQDAVPADSFLVEKLVQALDTNRDGVRAAVAYGRQLPDKGCRTQEIYTRMFNYPPKSIYKTADDYQCLGIKTIFCSDVCAMYNREIYVELGGFVPRAIFNEDMFYASKAVEAGYGIAYCAEAEVYHSHNYTIKEQLSRNFDMGVSQADHPEIFNRFSSESEGISLVKNSVKYLVRHGKWYQVPYLFVSSAAKLSGYRLGKRYKKLSRKRILKLTMNKNYWNRLNNQHK